MSSRARGRTEMRDEHKWGNPDLPADEYVCSVALSDDKNVLRTVSLHETISGASKSKNSTFKNCAFGVFVGSDFGLRCS